MKKSMLIIIIACSVLFTGCWDGIEINRRSMIFSVGIDKALDYDIENDIDYPGRYVVSYPIPDMGKLSGSESISEDIVSVEVGKSPTFLSSVDDVQTKTQNTINFGHTKAIIIGVDLLKDSDMMREIVDSLERNMLFARSTPIFAVNDKAEYVTSIQNKQHPIIGLYIMNYINNKERAVGRYKEALLGNVIRQLREENLAIIPVIKVLEEDNIEISSGALIKDYKLNDWLSQDEIRGVLWIDKKVQGASIPVVLDNQYISYTVREQDTKVEFEFDDNNNVKCIIKIINEGEIGEYYISKDSNLTSIDYIRYIESLVSDSIKSEIDSVILKSKKYNADIAGLKQNLYIQHPKKSKEVLAKWDDFYKDLNIDVVVDTKIRRTGIIE